MDVVVVESPAKARTINKYLGSNYIVLASYGHIRDLPSKTGSVRPEEGFAMTYVTDDRSIGHLNAIAKACKGAEHLYLATDPDREGEAISWHIQNALAEQKASEGVEVKRIVFNEVTKSAVLEAMANPRDIDMDLVNAQQARRALDYLVGFTLSPVLWRKLPGAKSAGRVQSVALRLICERDLEIDVFNPQEYWSIEADFMSSSGAPVKARLRNLSGEKVKKFSFVDEAAASAARAVIEAAPLFKVQEIGAKETRRHPAPPFTTSTLQQEASRKLRMPARRTMQVAQKLYEGVDIGGGETVGLISYMRTDGVQIAGEALTGCRSVITADYGDAYLPDSPRVYKTKAKNAQEAHEAIRPTDLARRPKDMKQYLDQDQAKLYELIWKRTIASQMESARIQQASIDISASDGNSQFRATGSVILFDGFLTLYQEGKDDDAKSSDGGERTLPRLKKDEGLELGAVLPEQHFTEPPPRYSEATLVKKLEELGIGRPSTYASILSVLQDRNYVTLEQGQFFADDRGQLVTAFLVRFFKRYLEYDFTADLEDELDEVSAGQVVWTDVLQKFWTGFEKLVKDIEGLRVRDVLDALNELLGPHVFHASEPGLDPRKCPTCDDGQLSLKVGKFGAFVGCSNYPECRFTRALAGASNGNGDGAPVEIGKHPESDLMISLRRGPYGPYLQVGEPEGDVKPNRRSIPKDVDPDDIDLEQALSYLSLPRHIGQHPETGKKIVAGIGRFGPYIRHDGEYRSLGKDESVLVVGLNRAVSLLAEPKQRRGPKVLKSLGEHPDDGKPVQVLDGRYGPYIKHNKTNATIPAGTDPEDITLAAALLLVEERAKKGKKKTPKKAAAKKKTAKKAAVKKKAKKKASPKKKSTAKSKDDKKSESTGGDTAPSSDQTPSTTG